MPRDAHGPDGPDGPHGPRGPRGPSAPQASRGYGQGYAYFAMALTFAIAILVFGALGWALDGRLGTRPLFAIAGGFLGGFAGFMRIYYRVKADTDAGKRGA